MGGGADRFEVERVLAWAGFGEFRRVSGRLGIADLFDQKRRTGVYVLSFRDGSYYVGKATDVTGRFRDHRDKKDPIEGMAFREVPAKLLDRVEQDSITALELLRVPLKNITSTRAGAASERFENTWASRDEIRLFSTDRAWNDLSGDPLSDPDRRAKLHDRFCRLMQRSDAVEIIEGFALYLARCVPLPARTLLSRWVISALPEGYKLPAIANLTIGWQWSAVAFEGSEGPMMQFYARGSVLKRAFGSNLGHLDGCDVYIASEVMGGTDQLRLVCRPSEAPALLEKEPVVHALREVALDLMQRPAPRAQHHCFDLSDAILTRARSLPQPKFSSTLT